MEKPLNRDIFSIRHFHVSHNAPYLPPPPPPPPPPLLPNPFSFLLSITAVPTETENNGWAKFGGGGGQISCIMRDVQVAFLQILLLIGSQKALFSLETLWTRRE